VFVDTTGRRRRWVRRGAIGGVTLVTAYGIVVALSFLGGPVSPNSLLPLPGLPGPTTPAQQTTSTADALGNASATNTPAQGVAKPGTGDGAGAAASAAASPSLSPSASPSVSPSASRRGRQGRSAKSPSAAPTSGHGH
jgi:hypothetical protein